MISGQRFLSTSTALVPRVHRRPPRRANEFLSPSHTETPGTFRPLCSGCLLDWSVESSEIVGIQDLTGLVSLLVVVDFDLVLFTLT